MRRLVIFGLFVLLVVVILLDYETASDNSESAAILPTFVVITATPPGGPPPTAEALPTLSDSAFQTTHLVVSGDNLFTIAQTHNITVESLMQANNIDDPNLLFAGQVLVIPFQPTPENTAVPTAVPAMPPEADPPDSLNGLALETIIVMPEPVQTHIREIYVQGQALGRNARAFSKLGDSTIEPPFFLTRFDDQTNSYTLGQYDYLQPVIDYFAGSFGRRSSAVRRGLHTWTVMDTMWSPRPTCDAGEHMLACEFRLNQPSVLFIRLGSNDAGIPGTTDKSLREIVEYSLEQGVIPVLGTKADRAEGPGNINNNIIRQIASDYAVPLWDYDLVAGTLPGRGLVGDQVHMTTFYAYDFTSPQAMQRAQSVHDLTALMTLDRIWRTVASI